MFIKLKISEPTFLPEISAKAVHDSLERNGFEIEPETVQLAEEKYKNVIEQYVDLVENVEQNTEDCEAKIESFNNINEVKPMTHLGTYLIKKKLIIASSVGAVLLVGGVLLMRMKSSKKRTEVKAEGEEETETSEKAHNLKEIKELLKN